MNNPNDSFLESLRLGLIRWNIAPLAVVAVLIYILLACLNIYQNTACTITEWQVAALFPFMFSIAGILYKIYDSMQRDRRTGDTKNEDNTSE